MCAGARMTTNVELGRHVHLHVNTAVGHDAHLGDHVSVFPGATVSGNVTVGDQSTVGTGANLLPGVTVGVDCFVGAGAVVVDDVPDGATVVGSAGQILAMTTTRRHVLHLVVALSAHDSSTTNSSISLRNGIETSLGSRFDGTDTIPDLVDCHDISNSSESHIRCNDLRAASPGSSAG